jgi:hypothetical protein
MRKTPEERKKSGSFLKKRTKKLLLIWATGVEKDLV